MTADIRYPEKPWQNAAVGSRNKLNVLFNDGYISDLTITFPGKEIRYKTHKVILAMSSSVFEGMLFGPMAITGSELELPDDNPESFKIVLAHCYEVTIVPSDIDVALETYMLADKYFLEQLGEECSHYIVSMINSENINKVLEFAFNFCFDSLKKISFEHMISSKASLIFQQDRLKELLELDINIPELVFEDSWKYPDEILQEDIIIQILKSENCRNQGLRKFSGCVSAKVVSNICWAAFQVEGRDCNRLYLSFTNLQQANEILSLLKDRKYTQWFYIHMKCEMFPAESLGQIPHKPYALLGIEPYLFLSNVDDNGIDWVVSAICSLKPLDEFFEVISFPRSKLTFRGLKTLLTKLASALDYDIYLAIQMCSSEIPSNKENELEEWILNSTQIDQCAVVKLYDINEDIVGW